MNATATNAPETTLSALGEALDAAVATAGNVGTSVTGVARNATAKVGSAISSGAYHSAYGLSYGVVFSAVFLKEFLPRNSTVRLGLEEGADAAFEAVASRRAEVEVAQSAPKPKRATKRTIRAKPASEEVIDAQAEAEAAPE